MAGRPPPGAPGLRHRHCPESGLRAGVSRLGPQHPLGVSLGLGLGLGHALTHTVQVTLTSPRASSEQPSGQKGC